jgi:hypothetical protein
VFNGTLDDQAVTLAAGHEAAGWVVVADTSWSNPRQGGIDPSAGLDGLRDLPEGLQGAAAGAALELEPQSMVVLLSDRAVPLRR